MNPINIYKRRSTTVIQVWGGKGKPPTSLLRKARAASGGGTYRVPSAVSNPTSVGMAPSRSFQPKVLLRAAHEVVPPQRREEGEPPSRRAELKCARSQRLLPPRRPPQQ
eukprot:8776288-Pyramimonas_sp.AAC.1